MQKRQIKKDEVLENEEINKTEIEKTSKNCSKLDKDEKISVGAEDTPIFDEENKKAVEYEDPEDITVSQEIAKEKLEEAILSQKPQKKKKSTIISLVLLAINIIFMIIVVKGLIANIGEQSLGEYIQKQGSRLWWLAGGVGCYILYILSQTLMFHALIKKTTGKSCWKLSYNVGLVGKYYDNVTPFAVGGQPMQIVELSKSGISPGVATSIPLIKLIINSMVSTILALLFFVFGLPRIPMVGGLYDFLLIILEILGIIGLIITLLGMLFMIIISTGGLFTRSLVSWIVKVGYKLKIVKNYRQTLKKWLTQVGEYKSSMKYLSKNKLLLFKMIIFSMLETLSYACISFFVVMAFFEGSEVSAVSLLFACIVKYYICAMAGSYIPLPGATGLMEIAFISLYSMYVSDAIVWALLAWRIISYYFIVVHGFTHEVISIVKGITKMRKNKGEN